MYVGETEEDAINRASLLVENMLQRPDQLQKVEQYKRRAQRKKVNAYISNHSYIYSIYHLFL